MKRSLTGLLIVVLTIVLGAGTMAAQKKSKPNGTSRNAPSSASGDQAKGEIELASDPRLQKIQKAFVIDAAKLAQDLEKKHDTEGARECYEQILRVVPNHPAAKEALERIHAEEMTADRKKLIVKATEGWQDTGINVIADRPLSIRADGTWTFKLERVLDADGMEIPKDLRDFNLGCLVGKIVAPGDTEEPKPFMVGKESDELMPEKGGRLYLTIYDSDPSDNKGQLSVEIQGTFEKGK